MTSVRSPTTLLALLLYVGVGLASPLADALVSHRGSADPAPHVEAAGAPGCHHASCVLDAPGAPQAPAHPPLIASRPVPVRGDRGSAALPSQQHHRAPARPHGPRAPPIPD